MADLEFNKQDIEDLAQKLATLWDRFSPQERDLLLAIFAMPRARLAPWPEAASDVASGFRLGPGTGSRSRLPSDSRKLSATASYCLHPWQQLRFRN